VVPVEGGAPPRVNGIPLESRGAELRPGDEIEIAGARLEFAVPQGPARS
jgi:hypothetical protein